MHDEAIGRRGVFHLFRLPEAVEQDIRRILTASGNPDEPPASQWGPHEDMLSDLAAMGAGKKTEGPGPRKIGSVSELLTTEAYERMADVYLSGFKANTKAFPYAEASE